MLSHRHGVDSVNEQELSNVAAVPAPHDLNVALADLEGGCVLPCRPEVIRQAAHRKSQGPLAFLACRLGQGHAGLRLGFARGVIAHLPRDMGNDRIGQRPQEHRNIVARPVEQPLEPGLSFALIAAEIPKLRNGICQSQAGCDAATLQRPRQCAAQVAQLSFQPRRPQPRIGPAQLWLDLLGACHKDIKMAVAQLRSFARRSQFPQSIVTDGLQQMITGLAALQGFRHHQRLVDQRSQQIQNFIGLDTPPGAHCFSRAEGEASAKQRKPLQQDSF